LAKVLFGESHGDFGQEEEKIDEGPCGLFEDEGRIGVDVIGGGLDQDGIFGKNSFGLFVPLSQFNQGFFFLFRQRPILVKMDPYNLTQGLGQLKQSGDEPRRDHIDEPGAVFSFVGFGNESEVGMSAPNVMRQIYIKRIRVVCGLGIPVPTLLLWINYVSLENLFMSVNQPSVLNSAQFFLISLVSLWRYVPVVQMNPVNLVLLNQLQQLLHKNVPSLFLPVIKHCCFFVINPPPFAPVKVILPSFLIDCHQFQRFILFTHPRRTHSRKTINDQFYIVLLAELNQLPKLLLPSQK
jgi:hypothetical protein